MGCSLTLEHYREILEAALEAGYEFRGFHQPFSSAGRVLYLRHDLDICIEEALDMATLEAELGVRSTYFILVNSPIYNPLAEDSLKLLQDIQRKGHWIGLHIDPALFLEHSPSGVEKHVVELLDFYKIKIPLVPVISFHRPRSDVLGRDFSAFVSAYSSRFFNKIKYISDSRGVWKEGCPCQSLREGKYLALQMLVHPIWWKSKETESIIDRLQLLLGERLEIFKCYLGANVEPIGKLLRKEQE